jgi:flavin-dependent dehydrogenase
MEIVAPSGFRYRLHYEQDGTPADALTLPRIELDHALVESAVRSGARLEEGVIARTLLTEDGVVRGVAASHAGSSVRVTGSMVVIADGARSTLRRALGLDAPVRWPNRMGLIAHFEGGEELDDGFGQMHVAQGGYCGLAPLPGGGMNVGLVIKSRRHVPNVTASQVMDRWISQHPILARSLRGSRRVSPVRGMAPVGARARAHAGSGFLLTGDAAGFFDPFTGEGIHRALVGGEIAAETALHALSAGFGASDIRAYEHRRRMQFRKKEMVTRLVQTFVRFPRLLEYALPRLRARQDTGDLLSAVLGDIADPASFLRPGPLWNALRP